MTEELQNPKFRKTGYIQIYTSEGKGKTTASMGLALRALGSGWKVLIMQFCKGGDRCKYGEYNALNSLKDNIRKNLKYKNCGFDKVVYKANLTDEDKLEAQKGWFYIIHNAKEYDMIVLDEINIALDLDTIHIDQVLDFLKNKPKRLEVVMTGRIGRPEIREKLFEVAHLITGMNPIKHYIDIGVKSRRGVEY
ncbi:MAG TPA: cob(I)yrinic acid a,c-diamide adenosyltransferase [Clostridiales bacterium]|nr:cob(I)yrinic acid a,c-diamide adenosyltransferase [Clostridiales bacterium]